MKHLLIVLMLLVATNASGQSFGKKNKTTFTKEMGLGIGIGGALLTVGVAVTPMEYSKLPNGRWTPTSYWKQTAQFSGIVTGVTLTGTGFITALLKHEPKRRRR